MSDVDKLLQLAVDSGLSSGVVYSAPYNGFQLVSMTEIEQLKAKAEMVDELVWALDRWLPTAAHESEISDLRRAFKILTKAKER